MNGINKGGEITKVSERRVENKNFDSSKNQHNNNLETQFISFTLDMGSGNKIKMIISYFDNNFADAYSSFNGKLPSAQPSATQKTTPESLTRWPAPPKHAK